MSGISECIALDAGTEYLRFSYVENRACPEPVILNLNKGISILSKCILKLFKVILKKNNTLNFYKLYILGNRRCNTMIAMKDPPLFEKKAHLKDPRLIIAGILLLNICTKLLKLFRCV